MNSRLTLILGTMAASAVAFAQLGPIFTPTDSYQIGYAANLNIGDSVVNLSNSGWQGGFIGATPPTVGNICVNVYVFDPTEEMAACCACLVTPNGLNSLSGQKDLIIDTLTPAVPTSVVIKLVASQPGTTVAGAFMLCNASMVGPGTASAPYGTTSAGPPATSGATGSLAGGMVAWGTTLEPLPTLGSYGVVSVDFKKESLSSSELTALTTTCNFLQNESGFGICNACRTGALAGAKN
jgi:hypothetical protein